MRRIPLHASIALLCAAMLAAPFTAARPAVALRAEVLPPAGVRVDTVEAAPREVVLRAGSRLALGRAEAEAVRTGGVVTARSRDRLAVSVRVPDGLEPAVYARLIEARVPLEVAEPLGYVHASAVPDDPGYPEQWGLPAVGAPAAWDLTTGNAAVVIAVIDSGVDLDHPDLVGRIAPGGYDFVDDDTVPADGYWHGTHVAGIAAATANNGVFGSGLAPGCLILPLRVLDDTGKGVTADVAEAIRYAADAGADVINLSLGSATRSDDMRLAVEYALARDVVIVASSGNRYPMETAVQYPAAEPGVLAVGAVGSSSVPPSPSFETLSVAPFSNRGAELDLVAPGVAIRSTTIDGWAEGTGTSMASPFVAGAAALVRSRYPSASQADVAAALLGAARDMGTSGRDDTYGFGLLDAAGALRERVTVHRFYSARLGAHFYTASEAERASVAAALGDVFAYEGVAYRLDPATNPSPLHRFYNVRTGTHFYTASEEERALVQSTLASTFRYEGVAYGVAGAWIGSADPVFRFYNRRNGTHFYTADPAERDAVAATLGHVYTYEGVAFHLAR